MPNESFLKAFQEIKKLAADFRANSAYYLSNAYQEQQARQDFIDKFFTALGWDVNHNTQKNPYAQEVKVEIGLAVGAGRKRADYAFYLAPNFRDVRFYAEAKKPVGLIASDVNYFQTIRYGWNSQTPLAILTDFEEFHVLDCRYTPDKDTAIQRALLKFHYSDYENEKKFSEIYHLFSREAVGNNAIENFVETLPRHRGKGSAQLSLFPGGYKSIDELFLDELDGLRMALAKNFKNSNPKLDGWELTEITQRALDRLVFMRFLEDKLIEPEDLVSRFGTSGSAWQDFSAASRKLDKTYNGTIFKKHAILDEESFKVSDDHFADICEGFSNLNSPYDFNTIPIHILGSIYERFLGKIITVSDKRAKVEDKPEVKKAGGVFYTPEFIVRYIVENTIGKLIEGKTPEEIANMRFADIACGSGSFLLGAYDYLLRYHTKYYNDYPKKAKDPDCVRKDGALYLSLHKKKEILLNNIYGVDISLQAVEVAQLSLYLKLLEDETTGATAGAKKETVLPPLNKNILCGNSLVGPDFYEGVQETMDFDGKKDEERKINVFDWDAGFPDVMRNGGFDAVIGNPPYVRQEMLGEFKGYFERKYKVFHGTADLYTYFFERGVSLLNERGLFSIIVANKWMRANYGEPLRKWLKEHTIHEIVDFGDLPVFQNVTTYPCIITLSKKLTTRGTIRVCKVENLEFKDLSGYVKKSSFKVNMASLKNEGWSLTDEKSENLLNKIKSKGVPLVEYVQGKIYRGVLTGLNEAFVIDDITRKRIVKEDPKSKEVIKPFALGRDIKRYEPIENNTFLIFLPKGFTKLKSKNSANPWKWVSTTYPAIAKHLSPFEKEGEKRCDQGDYWWELRACDYYEEFEKPKIVYPNICKKPEFTYENIHCYTNQKCFIIPTKDIYLLGLLNSSLMNYFFQQALPKLRGDFFEPSYVYMKDFPVLCAGESDLRNKNLQSTIVSLVSTLLELHKQLSTTTTDGDRARITQRIASADRRIDEIIYDLYGLTEEEKKIVEESFSKKSS